MPTLLLLRHAKSSWADPGMADRDRPLSQRGRQAAERMAHEIDRLSLLPDRILCSPARRTRETLAPFCPIFADKPRLQSSRNSTSPTPVRLPRRHRRPRRQRPKGCWSSATIRRSRRRQSALLGAGRSKSTAPQLAAKFPTAALAVIDFGQADWDQHRRPEAVASRLSFVPATSTTGRACRNDD